MKLTIKTILLVLFFSGVHLTTTPQSQPLAIYHAFDETFQTIIEELSHIAWAGYSHIQVSPIQHSRGTGTADDPWYFAYQPITYIVQGKYGDEESFKKLLREAKQLGIGIIVDVVFNHVAQLDNIGPQDWAEATYQKCAGHPELYDSYIQQLVTRHTQQGFTAQDFNPYKAYPHFRHNFSDETHKYSTPTYPHTSLECGIWLYGELPSLNQNSPRVQAAQEAYLDHLIHLGVQGFRFDATKHIPPFAWQRFAEHLKEQHIFFYGELFGSKNEYDPYNQHGPSTDYPLLYSLVDAFQWQRFEHNKEYGNLHSLRVPHTNGDPNAVTFAETHDTKMGRESSGAQGLTNSSIHDEIDRKLATLFLIARHDGVPLIFNTEHKLFLPSIINALKFRKFMHKHGNPPDYIEPIDHIEHGINLAHNLIFLKRGGAGFMVLNKSGENLKISFSLSTRKGKLSGWYRQITNQKGRLIFISNNTVTLSVPARSALFFVKYTKKQKTNVPNTQNPRAVPNTAS